LVDESVSFIESAKIRKMAAETGHDVRLFSFYCCPHVCYEATERVDSATTKYIAVAGLRCLNQPLNAKWLPQQLLADSSSKSPTDGLFETFYLKTPASRQLLLRCIPPLLSAT